VTERSQLTDVMTVKSHEPERTNVRGVLAVVAGLFGMLALVAVLVWLTARLFLGDRQPDPAWLLQVEPGHATHWIHPGADLARAVERQKAHISGYSWVDREHGIVRIPIERAIDVAVEALHGSARGGAK
jgi:hypothetical protein